MTFVVRPFASKYPLTPLPIRSNNYLLTFRRDGRQFVIKIYQPKPLTLKRLKYMLLSTLGVSIPVEYRSCQDRCEFERSCYELWRKRGFAVPEIVPCSPEIDPKRY